MEIQDLKHKFVNKISLSKNNQLLEEMYRLLTNDDSDMDILELNQEQTKMIENAREQYRNGQFLSQKQADEEIDEWLGK